MACLQLIVPLWASAAGRKSVYYTLSISMNTLLIFRVGISISFPTSQILLLAFLLEYTKIHHNDRSSTSSLVYSETHH